MFPLSHLTITLICTLVSSFQTNPCPIIILVDWQTLAPFLTSTPSLLPVVIDDAVTFFSFVIDCILLTGFRKNLSLTYILSNFLTPLVPLQNYLFLSGIPPTLEYRRHGWDKGLEWWQTWKIKGRLQSSNGDCTGIIPWINRRSGIRWTQIHHFSWHWHTSLTLFFHSPFDDISPFLGFLPNLAPVSPFCGVLCF